MEYYSSSNTLIISQSESIASCLKEYPETNELQIRGCAGIVEIDAILNDYPNIAILQLSSDGDNVYKLGVSLSQLTHITSLILFSTIAIDELPAIPKLEKLSIVIEQWEGAVENIYKNYPNLVSLTLWGSDNKTFRKLSPEISKFKKLKELFLRDCMFKDLPLEGLSSLKSLTISTTAMNLPFCASIGQLSQLESLYYHAHIPDVPTELAQLSQLKTLSFRDSFDAEENPEHLDVFEKLNNLNFLELIDCEIENLDFVSNKSAIKELNLEGAALTNLHSLKEFTSLETLILKDTESLESLEGIAQLPLKYLDLRKSDVEDIGALAGIDTLEFIDIKKCNYIKDFSPILRLNNLTELIASSKQLKKLEAAKSLMSLPEPKMIIASLNDCNLEEFESAIDQLATLVEASKSDKKTLIGYFEIPWEEEKLMKIPLLDTNFIQFAERLSESTLVKLLSMTLVNIGLDNFKVTLLALDEVLRRNSESLEIAFVAIFKKSCDRYDYGHRYFSGTVQDKIIDTYFPHFSTVALIKVLEIQHNDFLNSETGDQADQLFAYAFAKIKVQVELDQLWKVLKEYYEEGKGYSGKEYFNNLYKSISKASVANVFHSQIAEQCQTLIAMKDYSHLLNEDDHDIISASISSMNVKENEEFLQENIYEVLDLLHEADIDKDIALTFFRELMQFDWPAFNGAVSFIQHYLKNQSTDEIIVFLEGIFRKGNSSAIFDITLSLCHDIGVQTNSLDAIIPYMVFMENKTNQSRNISLEHLITSIYPFLFTDYHKDKRNERLDLLETLINEFEGKLELDDNRLSFCTKLRYLSETNRGQNWLLVVRICKFSYPIIQKKLIIKTLGIALQAVTEVNDKDLFELSKPYIDENTANKDVLFFAAKSFFMFGENKDANRYVKLAKESGVTSDKIDEILRQYN